MNMLARAVLGQQGASAAAFDVESDITWSSLWWVGSSAFAAEGYANGAEVTNLPGTGANGFDLDTTVAGPHTGPSYVAASASFNSRPAISFTTQAQRLVGVQVSNKTQPFTLVLVGRSTGTDTNNQQVMGTNLNKWTSSGTSTGRFKFNNGTNADLSANTVINNTTSAALGVFVADGASSRYVENGTQVGTAINPGTNNLSSGQEFALNASGTGAATGIPIDVALAAIYNGDLTADGNYAAFKSWVASHYGLTIA